MTAATRSLRWIFFLTTLRYSYGGGSTNFNALNSDFSCGGKVPRRSATVLRYELDYLR